MFVTKHSGVWDRDLLDRLWALYEIAYEPIAEAAVSREVLHRSEFDDVLRDPTFRVWLLWDDEEPVAMCVVATDLARSRYLSRPYFEKHYPEHYRNGTVHYIYWMVVHPEHEARGTIARIAKVGLAVEADEGALLVFDTPEVNERSVGGGFAQMMERLGQMIGVDAPVRVIDVQRYYAIDLSAVRFGDAHADESERDGAGVRVGTSEPDGAGVTAAGRSELEYAEVPVTNV